MGIIIRPALMIIWQQWDYLTTMLKSESDEINATGRGPEINGWSGCRVGLEKYI